jgi:hypothetical protein
MTTAPLVRFLYLGLDLEPFVDVFAGAGLWC